MYKDKSNSHVHTCELCEAPFVKESALFDHQKVMHETNEDCSYKCLVCSETESSYKSICYHVMKMHQIYGKDLKKMFQTNPIYSKKALQAIVEVYYLCPWWRERFRVIINIF